MKVLIVAGEKYNKLVEVAKTLYESSIDITGIKYLDDIRNYLNRGETFDRAVIFDKAYTLNDADTDVDSIKSRVANFVDEVQSRMSRYNLVFCATDDVIGLGIVEVTLNIGSNAIVISQGSQKVNKTFLSGVITTSMDNFSNKYKVLDMNDLRKYQIENTKSIDNEMDDTIINDEPSIVDEVTPIDSEFDPFANSDDPFSDDKFSGNIGFGDEDPFTGGNTSWDTSNSDSDPFSSEDDPFSSEDDPFSGEDDPFSSEGDTPVSEELDPFSAEDDPFKEEYTNDRELIPPTFLDDDPFAEDIHVKEPKGNVNPNSLEKDSCTDEEDPFTDEAPIRSMPVTNEEFNTEGMSLSKNVSKTTEQEAAGTGVDTGVMYDTLEEDPFADDSHNNTAANWPGDFNESVDPFDDYSEHEEAISTTSHSYNQLNDEEFSTSVQNTNPSVNIDNTEMEELFSEDEDTNSIGAVEDIHLDEEPLEKPTKGLGKLGNKQKTPKNQPVAVKGTNAGKVARLKERLEVYKRTGGIITVTGGPGSGKTTIAANLANILCKMGYQVLVIDMDTSGRGQSYINYDNYTTIHSGDTNVSGIKAALNSTSDKTGRFTEIIRSGFHLLGTGLKVDKAYPNDCLDPVRVNKFLHGCQSSYNFIIIDLPFDAAISKFSDMINQADHVVLVEKLSNHGMMNFMLDMLNIEDEQLMEDMFDKAKLVFNMDDGCTSLFGKKVSSTTQALTALDIRASELLGFQIDYSFAKMTVVDILKYNREFEKYWFSKKYISDTKPGEDLFTNLLVNIFEI